MSGRTSTLSLAVISSLCVALLVSVVRADRVIGAVHNDTLTSYLGGFSPVQGVRPQVWQRGKNLDGSAGLPELEYAMGDGPSHPSAPPSVADDGPAGSPGTPGASGPRRCFIFNVGGSGPLTGEPQNEVAGVDTSLGAYGPFEVDVALPAEVPWVIGRTYNAVQRDGSNDPMDSHGYQGVNWMQTSQPEIVFYDDAGSDANDMIYVILGAGTFLEYKRSASSATSFIPTNG